MEGIRLDHISDVAGFVLKTLVPTTSSVPIPIGLQLVKFETSRARESSNKQRGSTGAGRVEGG